MLSDAGYDVITAATFQDARRILRESPPDLLIADVRLGSFNGLQLVIGAQHRIPSIVITGYADAVLEAEARRGGAEYLVKPFNPERLLMLIRSNSGTRQRIRSPSTLETQSRRRPDRAGGRHAGADCRCQLWRCQVRDPPRRRRRATRLLSSSHFERHVPSGGSGVEKHADRRNVGLWCCSVAGGVDGPAVVWTRRHGLLRSGSSRNLSRSRIPAFPLKHGRLTNVGAKCAQEIVPRQCWSIPDHHRFNTNSWHRAAHRRHPRRGYRVARP